MTLINVFVFELYSVYFIFEYIEDSKEFVVGISERNLDEILTIILLKSMAGRFGQKYSRIRIRVENQTKVFENQNSCRESDESIRESEFVARIRQNYSRIRICGKNIEQKYSRIRIHGENIEQNYSRIRIHGKNQTKLFENQNSWRESDKTI